MALSKDKYVRELDATEQFVDASMIHRNLCSAASVSIKTKKSFKFDDIVEALDRFQKNHFQLQVTIRRTSEPAKLGWNPLHLIKSPKPVPKVEFWTAKNAVVPFQWIRFQPNERCEKAILELGIQSTFEEGQLLWRAYYIDQSKIGEGDKSQEGTFALICHSSITDNRGLFLLLDYFLEEFDSVLKAVPFVQKETKIMSPMLDTFDEKYKKPITWGESIKFMVDMASCMFSMNRSIYGSRNAYPIIPDYTTRHILFEVSKEQSTRLLQKVKENSISVRGLLTACALAATHYFTKNSKDELLKFWTTHELNLRVYSKDFERLKGRIEGCHCTYMETSFATKGVNTSAELWSLAADAHADITPRLSSELQAKLCLWFGQMGSPYGFFEDLGVKKYTRQDFAVVVDDDLDELFGEREYIQIDNTFGTISSHSMGSPFKHILRVFKGQIYYTFLYYGNHVKFDAALEMGQKTLSYLQMAAE